MQYQIVKMVNPRIELSNPVIQGQGKPCQWYPIPQMESREHPKIIMRRQGSEMRVPLNGFRVIPIDELVMERGPVN
jgi:hypothetical protein